MFVRGMVEHDGGWLCNTFAVNRREAAEDEPRLKKQVRTGMRILIHTGNPTGTMQSEYFFWRVPNEPDR